VGAEERFERFVEDREVFMPVDQQCRQRRTQVRAAADANPLGRLNGIDHPLAVHVHAGGAKYAAEEQEV
jgi:hypothetical protein